MSPRQPHPRVKFVSPARAAKHPGPDVRGAVSVSAQALQLPACGFALPRTQMLFNHYLLMLCQATRQLAQLSTSSHHGCAVRGPPAAGCGDLSRLSWRSWGRLLFVYSAKSKLQTNNAWEMKAPMMTARLREAWQAPLDLASVCRLARPLRESVLHCQRRLVALSHSQTLVHSFSTRCIFVACSSLDGAVFCRACGTLTASYRANVSACLSAPLPASSLELRSLRESHVSRCLSRIKDLPPVSWSRSTSNACCRMPPT